MRPEADLFSLCTRPLNRLGLPYMVTGAAASIVYGVPRLTHDLDIVIELRARDGQRFLAEFPEDRFYRPPWEVVLIEAARPLRGHFNLIEWATGFKADIYLMGDDPLHLWAMARELQYFLEGGSEKHLRDIVGGEGPS